MTKKLVAEAPAARSSPSAGPRAAAFVGLTGAVSAGFSGGTALDMATPFLPSSIAAAVIGGTFVAGRREEG
ncbi:hypothetical protein [Benzoatithermus flavus]|uniref:Uncharacterized protein n=1 Tax=Benzoatithermus flavus TaxID=3108223 RepID=A0ABU8XV85_9PROT